MDRHLTLEAVRLSEAAALYASRHMGKGNETQSYESATDAMVKVFSSIDIDGKIIVGSKIESSPLYDGAEVGSKDGPEVDLAIKPLDGKKTCASGGYNAISIAALGEKGAFFECPNLLMKKIAVGKEVGDKVDINMPVDINIRRVARVKDKYIEDITICVLDREENRILVEEIRKTGAKIKLLSDGDISGAIATAMEDSPIDMLMGVGGSKEGIIAAAALKCLNGYMQAKLIFTNNEEKEIISSMTHNAPSTVFTINDLAQGNELLVSATGVTDGAILPGVRYFSGGAETSSLVLRQKTHTLRMVQAVHHFDYKPVF